MMQLGHDGRVLLAGRVWDVDRMGLPSTGSHLLGANPRPRTRPFRDDADAGVRDLLWRRVVEVAIADQVGAALRPLFGSRV